MTKKSDANLNWRVYYNGELTAAFRWFFEANMMFADLVKRGQEHESVYPFVCSLWSDGRLEKVYESAKPLTQAQVSSMIEEYGI